MTRTLITEISEFEARLKLPSGFYFKLLEEDDWSFVIKLSSLFEGACTQVLSALVDCPELNEVLVRMDMAAPRGKIDTLRKFGSLSDDQAKILKVIAELRNDLVHGISKVGFRFENYFEGLVPSKVDQQVKLFGHGLIEQLQVGNRKVPRAQFVRDNIKLSIWLTASEVLACLHLDIRGAELRLTERALDHYNMISDELANNLGLGHFVTGLFPGGQLASNCETGPEVSKNPPP